MFGLRNATTWQNIILLSGEEPITSSTSKEGVKNRVIEVEENNPILEDVGTVVNVISDNYGFAGKEFIELLIKLKDSLKKDFSSIVTLLSSDKNYTKQSNALAIILLADGIVSKMIFEDEPLSIEDAKRYLRQDTDEADRYIEIILDICNMHRNNFFDNAQKDHEKTIGEIWGKIERNNNGEIEYFYFTPEKLREILSNKGIKWDGIKVKLAAKGYIQKSNDGGYAITQKINGTCQRVIKIKNIHTEKVTSDTSGYDLTRNQ